MVGAISILLRQRVKESPGFVCKTRTMADLMPICLPDFPRSGEAMLDLFPRSCLRSLISFPASGVVYDFIDWLGLSGVIRRPLSHDQALSLLGVKLP
jgi:hypothetical protein